MARCCNDKWMTVVVEKRGKKASYNPSLDKIFVIGDDYRNLRKKTAKIRTEIPSLKLGEMDVITEYYPTPKSDIKFFGLEA